MGILKTFGILIAIAIIIYVILLLTCTTILLFVLIRQLTTNKPLENKELIEFVSSKLKELLHIK